MTARQVIGKYNKAIKDDFAIATHANLGIEAEVFFDIVIISGLSKTLLAENVFDVSIKTLMRYKQSNKKLNPKNSETALKLLSMFKKGIEVFGSMESLVLWLKKPVYGLMNKIPIQIMTTTTGIDLIEDELIRIEYGVLA